MDGELSCINSLDRIFFSVIFGTALGVVICALVRSFVVLPIIFGICFCTLGFVCKKKNCIFVGIFLFSLVLGMLRFDIGRPDVEYLAGFVGDRVSVTGVIEEPAVKSSGVQFVLNTKSGVNILVGARSAPTLLYGDEVSVAGALTVPENFTTDQGTQFDYVSYLSKDDILYQIKNAKVEVLSHDNGNVLIARLIPFKNYILESFRRVLPRSDADLLAGLDLGEKSSIGPKFRDDLVTTGTIHIIALSGQNVSIIANALRDFFTDILGFNPRVAGVSGAIGIILFVVMTGLQSSAVRAGIMALIGIYARGRGRTYNAFRALVFAGFLMILWNPKYLIEDVSFQLSFLATLGIIFIMPILERKFARIPKKVFFILPLRELTAASLGAQIAVLPFILYKMGTLSLIALPTNILILPVIPFAMGFGGLAGFIGMLSVGLALPVSWLTHVILKYITAVVTYCARIPHAAVIIKNFPLMLCLLLYAVLTVVLYRTWKRYEQEKPLA